MNAFIDHYLVLGLPSGHQSFKISNAQITKAYRSKALELHPDKRPEDPNAVARFQSLQASYEILKNEHKRQALDLDLKIRYQQQRKVKRQQKVKRRKRTHCDVKENNSKRSKYDDPEERKHWRTRVTKMMDNLNTRMFVMKETKLKRMKFDRDVKTRMASFPGMMKGLVSA